MDEVTDTELPPMGEPVEMEDGSALVDLNPQDDAAPPEQFGDNLATRLDAFTLNNVATTLLDLIEKDQEARKKRDKDYEEGIQRTGLGDDAPGGADFEGASRVVHPALAEGCVDFSARAIKELFPAGGPVKTKLIGKSDEQKLERARRKRDFLNWQLTTKMPEYRDEKEILLTQLPLGGSQYEKYIYDPVLKRPVMRFVPIDKILLPYSANSFYTSPRITEVQDVTEAVFEERVASGFYRDLPSKITSQSIAETSSQEATNKIEGKEATGYNEDGIRLIYEVTCQLTVEPDTFSGGKQASYVVHIDEPTSTIVGFYRNWDQSKAPTEALEWWVEDKFIPWRGVYGIGLFQLIGGMAASMTGSLRALLDSAHINNAATAIKLKGGRASGQDVLIDVTEVKEIDAPAGIDDIRKVIMPMPFNPPSTVLFQLLDWLTQQAKGVVATAEEKIADASNTMPVGTALALIEQGSQVFSSIHARLHASQARALNIICRLNVQYPNAEDMQRFGVTPEDFRENDDIEPVSDPNIFSETQRFAQMQAVLQMQGADAQDPSIPWNKVAIRRAALERLRIDNIDELLPAPPKPITADPMSENVAAMHGAQLAANPQQDHLAHMQCHLSLILSPIVAGDPAPDPNVMSLYQHCREHLIFFYQQMVMRGVQGIVQDQQAMQQLNEPQGGMFQ